MLTDTHCHLFLPEFTEDLKEVMHRAASSGINRFFLPNVDSGTTGDLLKVADRYPDRCFPMMGLHPTSVEEDYRRELSQVEDWLGRRKFYAIGEIGIDLYWDKTYLNEQVESFITQLRWADELGLPVVIHVRNSFNETVEAIQASGVKKPRGIFHCFTGTVEEARLVISMGFYLGIGGVLTFKNGGIEPLISELGLEHIVLETDSPYLAPVPKRGQRNEPAYLRYVAIRAAQLAGLSLEETAAITTKNSQNIFGI